MKGIKTQKGITLIALIITIIVLLILAGVSIRALSKDEGVIVKAQEAAKKYDEAQVEEEVKLYSMEYALKNQRSLKTKTVNDMTRVCKETGISPEKLTVHSNKDGSEYVLYRIDKTTEAEREVLEQNGVEELRGDVDFDGLLTQEDVKFIEGYVAWEIDFTEIQLEVGDINGDDTVDTSDSSDIEAILYGSYSYSGGIDY